MQKKKLLFTDMLPSKFRRSLLVVRLAKYEGNLASKKRLGVYMSCLSTLKGKHITLKKTWMYNLRAQLIVESQKLICFFD